MDYPHGFPDHLKPPVDTAFTEAEIEFAKGRSSVDGARDRGERLVMFYVMRVFIAFAHAAVKAVEESAWDGQQFRRFTAYYLGELSREVYSDKATWHHSSEDVFILSRRIKAAIEVTTDWMDIQNELRTALEHSAALKYGEKGADEAAIELKRAVKEIQALVADQAAISSRGSAKEPRRRVSVEPRPELLETAETLNKTQAAQALGISVRTLDRYVADGLLSPVGSYLRRRFKTRDLRSFMTRRNKDK